jgi:hypothetical protein
MEEYKESMLDAIEKERPMRQRARRAKIGTITGGRWTFLVMYAYL